MPLRDPARKRDGCSILGGDNDASSAQSREFPLPPLIGTLDPSIFRRGWLALSPERNADGYRLQCLARALVCVALFVIALRKRLTLVDRHAGRDHPPLIGNGLRDPIADETLAGLVLSGDAIAASSGLGLIMLVVIPVGIAGLLPYERSSLLGSSHRVSPVLLAPRSPPAVVRQHGRRTHFGES